MTAKLSAKLSFNPEALFDNLLVSSPNGGGLFALRGGQVQHLDGLSSTGLALRGSTLVRGLQPADWVIYDNDPAAAFTSVAAGIHCADIHDVLWVDDGFLMVSTDHNEVVRVSPDLRPVQRWGFAGELDSLHINCLARWGGDVVFSAFGQFAERRAYKGASAGAGFVQALDGAEPIITGLSQPHSLKPWGADLLLADSETRSIALFDRQGREKRRKLLDGYTRGIAIGHQALFVGLSASRTPDPGGLACATVVALDLHSWEELGRIALPAREIYEVLQVPAGVDTAALVARMAAVKINPYIYYE